MSAVDTVTGIDIEVLVGEMPAVPCDSEMHGNNPHHADGNEHYVILTFTCPCHMGHSGMHVACWKWIDAVISSGRVICDCTGHTQPVGEFIKVLEPANGSKR